MAQMLCRVPGREFDSTSHHHLQVDKGIIELKLDGRSHEHTCEPCTTTHMYGLSVRVWPVSV